jgi:hypothetical protein
LIGAIIFAEDFDVELSVVEVASVSRGLFQIMGIQK